MRPLTLFRLTVLCCSAQQAQSLRIACNQMWIEHTPIAYVIQNFYNTAGGSSGGGAGSDGDTATLVNGGVPNLSDKTVDLAANAETQGLISYARNRNLRLIGIVVEVGYRLVANRAAGVRALADLRGKRVGTMPGTSAEVFVHQLLASAGLAQADYRVVSGGVCMRAPCGAGTLPQLLQGGQVDAFGIWETAVELGIEALGPANAVVFQNASVYREVYSLYSTADKLRDAGARKRIVQFVRALNQTYAVFANQPDKVYSTVAQMVSVNVPVLQKVWSVHKWGPGSLGPDLVDYLANEDQYLSKTEGRQAFSRADLETFVDASVYQEAMQG
ncbi:uncharacterized protein THITE_2044737 [Thermothielavioides terrestris NRRL 8126]|uniref:SsuA/THI5-like domain-containing protein n=1 Tax=Thermothielavioides terrestris (strain ATCC 38088 / NRRL 8126) TaxID=578455 RepID=G2QZE0_THETT|nr:uncharacterized protein THITE_2044737 [Thermothielavioides terrestris NRRL 8126]AEO67173.1 hypothetical protein THITE_2044737 [Thermothielavioides terrestris NRRL 8126]